MKTIPLIEPPVQSMTLADGRILTWREFGTPTGRPALYFHGGGSFSLEAGIFHREAVQRDIRLIATNRPGAEGSDLRPGRPVAAYADDLRELLRHLRIDQVACLGESSGGMVTMAVAASMPDRILGAVPINPTLPWRDPVARRVSSAGAAWAYRLLTWWPWIVAQLTQLSTVSPPQNKPDPGPGRRRFDRRDLAGPPPGTEPEVAAFQCRVMALSRERVLIKPELVWATTDWGFDPHAIPARLDFFCGVHDAQAPFALVLADHNADARFHHFSYGHAAFSHPSARRRIFDAVASYFEK